MVFFEVLNMATTILADRSASISELKRNPTATMQSAGGRPVAILNHSKPAFYCVPAELYAAMLDLIEDRELALLVKNRLNEEEVEVKWEDL
ncbi:stbd replicon stabilization protein (antitoxin to StbE) [Yersinia frederiksenii]|jgi:antitoxin StbD|uniref:Antitoxin n=3 Tax=Yersinia TaxID=629 RepID=A0AAI8ZM02_YERFR|nr:stbd replicon stabilization protein (antitoxin to StbE) [Yersinia frederiksenii]CRY54620.1 stbd replicon stabilization protein (antitoxin to StbE) [Yersinia intermedia]CFR28597.1 stbd replicon stabilization protein (antitoxin to StbE) [Yersinia frederiksenii]CNF60730.1 stbd replicon stabilization protein (antitoxin to StbE) [Yersinia frederiksenii]CNK92490.1 stbd replicon stabilization protein (antitoxin to StbE) [Yersinia frederiksenii]